MMRRRAEPCGARGLPISHRRHCPVRERRPRGRQGAVRARSSSPASRPAHLGFNGHDLVEGTVKQTLSNQLGAPAVQRTHSHRRGGPTAPVRRGVRAATLRCLSRRTATSPVAVRRYTQEPSSTPCHRGWQCQSHIARRHRHSRSSRSHRGLRQWRVRAEAFETVTIATLSRSPGATACHLWECATNGGTRRLPADAARDCFSA